MRTLLSVPLLFSALAISVSATSAEPDHFNWGSNTAVVFHCDFTHYPPLANVEITQEGCDYPIFADYPYPEYAAMGQFVYDVKGVLEGFNEMLKFNPFLRRAKPMTIEVPGQRSELGSQTATWSGMIAEDKALVRTVSFNEGNPDTKTVNIYDRPVQLTFGPHGHNFWVYPDGKVEAAGE